MKALVLAIFISSAVCLQAQYLGSQPQGIPVNFQYDDVERSGNSMTINYDQSDAIIFGVNYKHSLFPIHRGYDSIPGQNLVYGAYTLDSLLKSDNSYVIPFNAISGLVLDTMDIQLGHVKHSGANDTLFLTLVALTTNNFPGGATLFTDTVVINSALSSGNILTNTTTLRWKPNYLMNNTPVGFKIEFVGSLQDTLALLGGYGIYPAPNMCTDSIGSDKARKSVYYANSYAYWSNFSLILPTSVGGDIFYDCNGNFTADSTDSESYIQNWAITSYVSAPQIGIEPVEDARLTIYPNPASNIIFIKGVDNIGNAAVYNCSGALVKTFANPMMLDVADLNNGIYIFAFQYENRTVHKKVVIQK